MRAVLPAEMSSPPPPRPRLPWRRGWFRLFLSTFTGVVASLAFLAAALFLNFFLARRFLRVEERTEPLARIADQMGPVATPLVLSIENEYGPDAEARRAFLEAVGLTSEAAALLPARHPQLVVVDDLARYNPYPPLLVETSGSIRSWMTFGYLGTDGLYHQVTHYYGEADTTPSPFVCKVRGNETHYGDHFVTYTIYGKKDPLGRPYSWDSETGEPRDRDLEARYLLIDRIDWSTYEGGSYDGLEEIEFTVIATFVEAVAVYLTIVTVQFRRFRRRRHAEATL